MAVLDVILAALPIALLVYWMTKKQGMPSNRALPLAALVLYLIQLVHFPLQPLLIHAAIIEGLLTALTPVAIVFGAILLFKTMERTGAMNTVREWLNGITSNKIAQLMVVGWGFSFLIEGVSGFGTPAALAAPLLVGLGFSSLRAAILCLMMNTVPVSFGAVGMPTWFGFGELGLSSGEMLQIGLKTSILHIAGAVVIPLLALRMIVSWREIWGNGIYIGLVIGMTRAAYIATAAFSVEFPAIAAGACGLLTSITLARYGLGLKKSAETAHREKPPKLALLKSTFPLWGTVLVLLLTRLEFIGLKAWLTTGSNFWAFSPLGLGELRVSDSLVFAWRGIIGSNLNWTHALLYVPSVVPFLLVSGITFLIYRTPRSGVVEVYGESTTRVMKPIGAFLGALVLVKLLMVGGESSAATVLGQGLAALAGENWQFAAVFLGSLGSFFSGSGTVSNLTFGGIQEATASQLGLDHTTILALQSVGGAMGNMVCIHNIVAVCSILGLHDTEGKILRKTFLPMLLYGALASLISLSL